MHSTRKRLLDRVVRPLRAAREVDAGAQALVDAEWLVTNGLGGYSSGTVAGVITRRYHGLLIAALPNPLGRTVMLNHLGERVYLADGRCMPLGGEENAAGKLAPDVARRIVDFRLEAGLPVWEYESDGVRIEKRLFMPHQQNTVYITYRLIGGDAPVRMDVHPAVNFRSYESPVNTPPRGRYTLCASSGSYVISSNEPGLPPLRCCILGARSRLVHDERRTSEFVYPVEESRGYQFRGTLWAPGQFEFELRPGEPVTLVASTETDDVMLSLGPDDALRYERERRRRLLDSAQTTSPAITGDEIAAELVLAADQFVITPVGRVTDTTRAAATGDEIRTVIAGYHWFTDWGRDTMISLEGLTLATGRQREAGYILRTFAHYVRDGLIPNMFPDGSNQGLYHTADATLWFFHALHRYVRLTGDRRTLQLVLPTLASIVDQHTRGTQFGIHADPADGLLVQGAEGYQLTWMDAKVEDWVVTPRRGKAVEINALWYNALCLLAGWTEDDQGAAAAQPLRDQAARVRESFNRRFWIAGAGYLYDIVDALPPDTGDVAKCRPNQILAIALDHPVLERDRWAPVVDVVRQRLLTPVGLRSLAPDDADYKKKYYGDLRARDAAYHQGTVWGWLIGPWVDAWLKVHPDDAAGARRFLDGLIAHLGEFGIGSIAEIFDAEAPYTPRGCIAQAWSVAEVLRCLARSDDGR